VSTSIPDPQAVLEQLEEIKRKYLEAQTDVASVQATGFDQDRQVSVTVLGLGEVSDIKIDPAAVNPADVEGLQRKIVQAFRSANNQARDLAARILSPLNISLPEPEPEAEPGPELTQEPAAPEHALAEPALAATSLPGAAPSLSAEADLTPALSAAPVPDLRLAEHIGATPEASAPVAAPSEALEAEPVAPNDDAPAEEAPLGEARPSLAHYQHYRPRW
jgi:DNA-binding protein YbaB